MEVMHTTERTGVDADLERASKSIDDLIQKRAAAWERANWEVDLWRKSEEMHRARERQRNRAAWYIHYCRLADAHASLSEEFAQRAEALCETTTNGEDT